MPPENWFRLVAHRQHQLRQSISRHAIARADARTQVALERSMRSAIDERSSLRKICSGITDGGSREGGFAQDDRPAVASGAERETNLHNARLRPEQPKIAAGIDDAAARSRANERFRRAIDGETLGDSA